MSTRTLNKQWIENGSLSVLILPVAYLFLGLAMSAFQTKIAIGIVIVLFLVPMALVLKRGRIGTALGVIIPFVPVLMILLRISSPLKRSDEVAIEFGNSSPVTNIKISCNDIEIGVTPFKINKDEFNAKVKPWPTPPKQPYIDQGNLHNPTNPYRHMHFYYTPYKPFESDVPSSENPAYQWDRNADNARDIIQSTQYWWHFEQNGCVGLSNPINFSGGGGGKLFRMTPQIEFPSVQPHLDRLVLALQESNGIPSPEWLSHWTKYQVLMFMPGWKRAQDDPYLKSAILIAVREEFNIPENPTEQDAERVLRIVIKRAQESNRFMVPSPESLAIDLLGKSASKPLVNLFLEQVTIGAHRGYWSGHSSSDNYAIWRPSPGKAGTLPLAYAVKQLNPPELFNLLVYEIGQSKNPRNAIRLVASYHRPEVNQIIKDFVLNLSPEWAEGAFWIYEFERSTPNQDLEDFYRQYFVNHSSHLFWGRTNRYIDSRIGAPGIDQRELAIWIFNQAPIDEHFKSGYLMKINDPIVSTYISMVVSGNESRRFSTVEALIDHPNPGATHFLIQSADFSMKTRQYLVSALCALPIVDTPEAKDYLKQFQDETSPFFKDYLTALWRAAEKGADVKWTVESLQENELPEMRSKVAQLLVKIGTPEALTTARQWAKDDPKIAQAIIRVESERKAAEDVRQQKLREAEALISGKMKPDDLIEQQPAWFWDGKDYVALPENQTSAR